MPPMVFRTSPLAVQREARLRYLDGDYAVIEDGDFVLCGVTGSPIRLENLKYWNVERQIAYRDADVAFADFLAHAAGK